MDPEDKKYKVGWDLWMLMSKALQYPEIYEAHLGSVILLLNTMSKELDLNCLNEVNKMYEEYKKCRECCCIAKTPEKTIWEEDCKTCYDFNSDVSNTAYTRIFENY